MASTYTITQTSYFDSLFDDFGIWQHADGRKPLPEHGYALDDATRGLLVCLALGKTEQAHVLFDYIITARLGNDFSGFTDKTRQPIQFPASEDAKGQVVWAMGYAASLNFEKPRAVQLIKQLTPSLLTMEAMRGQAYTLLGAIYVDRALALTMNHTLARRFENIGKDWFWPENTLTYGNGLIPYALLRHGLLYKDAKSVVLGRKILEFLEHCYTYNRIRSPIGNVGWFSKGDARPSDEGQQPIDATYMIMAWMCAYQLSQAKHDLENAEAWMRWFDGENTAHERMYDPQTLKAFDGIHAGNPDHHSALGVNHHSGAESNVCFLLARYVLDTKTTL